MRNATIRATLLISLTSLPGRAMPVTVLVSSPVMSGAGGTVCACTNLSQSPIVVDIFLRTGSGFSGCFDKTLDTQGRTITCSSSVTTVARTCEVIRDDGKPASKRHINCTLSAMDASGTPTVSVPVDKKRQAAP